MQLKSLNSTQHHACYAVMVPAYGQLSWQHRQACCATVATVGQSQPKNTQGSLSLLAVQQAPVPLLCPRNTHAISHSPACQCFHINMHTHVGGPCTLPAAQWLQVQGNCTCHLAGMPCLCMRHAQAVISREQATCSSASVTKCGCWVLLKQ